MAKVGEIPQMRVYPWGSPSQRSHRFQDLPESVFPQPGAHKTRQRFAAHETRHNFVVESLPKPGPFKSRPYLYTCMRCKWVFRVNDSPGSIITLDEKGQPLPEPERHRRAATFAEGPCPAFDHLNARRITQIQPQGWLTRLFDRFARQLEGLWGRWRGTESGHIPRNSQATTMIMPEDLLH
ncbi:MAG TPA: hypothetical protein VJX23_00645 [Candidatus Binataceae bacterium]|nr:hypothetical protein [Candidatus Binataceae bacterium]